MRTVRSVDSEAVLLCVSWRTQFVHTVVRRHARARSHLKCLEDLDGDV